MDTLSILIIIFLISILKVTYTNQQTLVVFLAEDNPCLTPILQHGYEADGQMATFSD